MKKRLSTHKPKADKVKATAHRFLSGRLNGEALARFRTTTGAERAIQTVGHTLKRGRPLPKLERAAMRRKAQVPQWLEDAREARAKG